MNVSSHAVWEQLGTGSALLFCLPFVLMLLLIAVLPLGSATAAWWEHHRNKLAASLVLAGAGIALFVGAGAGWWKVAETALDYLAFISLLASLFVVSGGISITGAFAGLPRINTLFLGLGAVLANFLGTTGASMLLIRPLIRANRLRERKTHIMIFFIFIVGNCGGLLTPLGDPPLYLGFLRGVPFEWTLRLLPQWALMVLPLLFIFHLLDEYIFVKEDLATKRSLLDEIAASARRIHIQGRRNLVLLAAILATVLFSGSVLVPWMQHHASHETALAVGKIFQIMILAGIGWWSWQWTPRAIHDHNHFNFGPILEVAILFLGIFGAMIPALALLEAKAPHLGLEHTWQFFWLTGLLSSFLDNAPTYLSFAALAAGKSGISADQLGELASGFPGLLSAISCGAVFMGANTYIGNGPNFMLKAIAENARIRMPSFGAYMLWSLAFLVPLFLLQTFIFFR